MAEQRKLDAFGRLLDIMDDLREKCPWDRKQTMQSLRKLSIEELYELGDAILEEDMPGVQEEIGDLMLHMVFYAKIAEEQESFDIADALDSISDKLIRRHPHIYSDVHVENEDQVKQNWEAIKLKEGKKSVLSGVPQSLPALIKAHRLQEKTAQVGFEWDHVDQVWSKVEEELEELKEAVNSGNLPHIEEEFGDVLFALVNYARFIKVDPESALEKMNKKFKSRFEFIESRSGNALIDMSLEQMDQLWNEAKRLEKR